MARKAIDAFGGIDILVNNAAFQRTYETLEEIPDDEFEETYSVNVFAMSRLCKALLPQMKEGSSIINTPLFSPSIPAQISSPTHRPKPPLSASLARSPASPLNKAYASTRSLQARFGLPSFPLPCPRRK